jgi:uncharacterized protein (TIGR02145 family)
VDEKNLDVVTYQNGDTIPQVSDPKEWSRLASGAWCYYNNDSNNNLTYGKLYNGFAVTDPRGLAPSGWHVSSKDEWDILVEYLGGVYVADDKMKETGFNHWLRPNGKSTNESGFGALPGGYRYYLGDFFDIQAYGYWWSINKTQEWNKPNAHYIGYDIDRIYIDYFDKKNGFSVRVVRD